jgi:hypothetical protein
MQHGSLVNMLMAGANKMVVPEVGMGATEVMFSDRHPYTVVEVKSERRIVVQRDNYKRTDTNGMSESQTYEYTPNPSAPKVVVTRRKDGSWREMGHGKGSSFMLGAREEYYDFSR